MQPDPFPPPPPSHSVRETIDLNEKEEKIFRRLLEVIRHFGLDTQLRVAGGWVRDKLLGKECYDIDIALDNMLGQEFCEKINTYLQHTGEEIQGVGVIQRNPEQSKHLETARMRVYDTWIDFVNLRSEKYVENSRIPTMEFGTAEEDAYRRDLTINSLFYNINTNSVEDLTGKGIQHLKAGLIATPLPPKATFLDDPLRVLRAIRFGARFGFNLDENLKKAASDEEVKTAIADKISRERIGHEIDLMISDNNPVNAMTYICELNLFSAVFTLPKNTQPTPTEESERLCVLYMEAAWKILQMMGSLLLSDEQRRLYLYAGLFLPFRSIIYTDNKLKKIPVSTYIIRNSLKLKASDAEMVVSIHVASERFISLIPILESKGESDIVAEELGDECLGFSSTSKRRVLAGLLLRQIKDFWRVALLISALLYPELVHAGYPLSTDLELDKRKEIFVQVEHAVKELDLDNVWKVKPLLDGKAIMGALQLKTGGPLVKEWQDKLIKWQLAHPEKTANEALDWMMQSQAKRAKLEPCA
ncbi:LOW QUALITY PROTEIN: tRNA nucleotidyltransferase cca2 [Dioscorea cayenensis subsp. rotundata]|uniref:LOW QUALITY PROTEIN: tRNA nucleotidyltransferase cca2 n=1 Tax=Dioscorea cayennensis subsp. rotundata TaxID=55577 RepID=A0AB40BZP4_DIOCR|nr:LOW QUALITY PROTEIN: tRNA nucleotidyltransferase cca2 [Dioscorea cayenensis subsp. rotundata]